MSSAACTATRPPSKPCSTPSPGFTDGRAALVLADAANESLRTGTTVKVVGA